MVNELVPVANFGIEKLHFFTCNAEHIKILSKLPVKKYDFTVDLYSKERTKQVINIARNVTREEKTYSYIYYLNRLVLLLDKDDNLRRFVTIHKYSIYAGIFGRPRIFEKIKIHGKLQKVAMSYHFDAAWRFGHQPEYFTPKSTIKYYFIYLRPEIVSYFTQKPISYYENVIDGDKITRFTEYFASLFLETEVNKELQKKELDDLLDICKKTLKI